MHFNDYQQQAGMTAVYPNIGKNFVYPTLGLVGEAGEVAEKIKKIIRDQNNIVTEEKRAEIKKELGDVLWYIAQLCTEFKLSFEEVAQMNLEKLMARMAQNKIHGDGDNRETLVNSAA